MKTDLVHHVSDNMMEDGLWINKLSLSLFKQPRHFRNCSVKPIVDTNPCHSQFPHNPTCKYFPFNYFYRDFCMAKKVCGYTTFEAILPANRLCCFQVSASLKMMPFPSITNLNIWSGGLPKFISVFEKMIIFSSSWNWTYVLTSQLLLVEQLFQDVVVRYHDTINTSHPKSKDERIS